MKKGLIFSLSSVMVAGFFIVVFSAPQQVPVDAGLETVSFRVNVLDRFSDKWEDFAGQSLRTSGYTALSKMSEHIAASGSTFSQATVQEDFKECLYNGTLSDGSENCSGTGERNNLTMKYWMDRIEDVASKNISFNITYDLGGVTLDQEFPFMVTVRVNLTYTISDAFATIQRNATIEEMISIIDIKDPLGASHLGDSAREIYETDIRESGWNKDNFSNFVNEEEFRYHEDAPSFLQRLVGDTGTSSCCGIESILATDQDPITQRENFSQVDHHYFEALDSGPQFLCDEVYQVTGISGVQIDDIHLADFNVSSDDWVSTC